MSLPYHEKVQWYRVDLRSFRHNTITWRWQTDGQREILYQYRASECWRAIKIDALKITTYSSPENSDRNRAQRHIWDVFGPRSYKLFLSRERNGEMKNANVSNEDVVEILVVMMRWVYGENKVKTSSDAFWMKRADSTSSSINNMKWNCRKRKRQRWKKITTHMYRPKRHDNGTYSTALLSTEWSRK